MRASNAPVGRGAAALAAVISVTAAARADTFQVYPGDRAISRAIVTARPGAGDVMRLHVGRYEETVGVPEGVTLEAAGDGDVVLAGVEDAVVRVTGAGVTIRGVIFEASGETRRGVDSIYPVRVEQCRFEGFPVAVALMQAPLSDVVHCDFDDCAIGVRAIGAASPTVWGCRFRGGGTGVSALDGGPYIRHNLFDGVEVGLRLASSNPHTMIVRNNVFHGCTGAGVEVRGGDFPFAFTSIRNCVFHGCAAAMTGPGSLLGGVSHCAVDGCGEEPFAATDGVVPDRSGWSLVESPLGLTVSNDGTVEIEHADALSGAGLREPTETPGTPGHIGLPPPFSRPGASLGANLAPPVRFAASPLIANAVSEQHLYLAMLGLRPRGQSLRDDDEAGMVDTHVVDRDGQQVEIVFSVARFFGETSGMTP